MAIKRQFTFTCILMTICGLHLSSSRGLNAVDADIVANHLSSIAYEMCRYNAFCETEGEDLPKGNHSCCRSCSCAVDCYIGQNCCPDAKVENLKDVPLTCKLQPEHFDRPRQVFSRVSNNAPTYYTIDTCPETYTNQSVIERCLRPTTIQEHAYVSDPDTLLIYKNEKCAVCNGVEIYERWTTLILCEYSDQLFSVDTRDNYILQTCSLVSEPPSHSENKYDSWRCRQDMIDRCNVTGEWDSFDEGLQMACGLYNMLYKHEYFSPSGRYKGGYLYRNPYCFLCNHKKDAAVQLACISREDFFVDKGLLNAPFTSVLDVSQILDAGDDGHAGECGNNGLTDPLTDQCVEFGCPFGQTPVHGQCIDTMVMVNINISLSALYTFEVSHFTNEPKDVQVSDEDMFDSLILGIQDIFSETGCSICRLTIYSENVIFVQVKTTFDCSLSKLMKVFEYLSKVPKIPLITDNGQLATLILRQTVEYSLTKSLVSGSVYVSGLKAERSVRVQTCFQGKHLDPKFYCKRIQFNIEALVSRGVSNHTIGMLQKYSVPTEFIDGVENYRWICLNDYMSITNTATRIWLCTANIVLILCMHVGKRWYR